MSNVDKTTIKVRAYRDKTERDIQQSNLSEDQNNALELVKKNAQLEEVKSKLLEHLKTIEQLRESLKQEQANAAIMVKKIAGLEARLGEMAALEAKAKQSAELEARVQELTEALDRISTIAAAGKAG